MATTRMSEKGQVVIPKEVRDQNGWAPGIELVVEDHGDGVVLRPLRPRRTGTLSALRGCAGYGGPTHTLEEMEDAIRRGLQGST